LVPVSVGVAECEDPLVGEVCGPALVVDEVVVPHTQRGQVRENRVGSVVGLDVVDLAAVERCVAPVHRTRAVHGAQRSPVFGCGEADVLREVDDDAVRVENSPIAAACTGESLGGVDVDL
jgi:hypothetical protein